MILKFAIITIFEYINPFFYNIINPIDPKIILKTLITNFSIKNIEIRIAITFS